MSDIQIPRPPRGLMVLALVGPSFVWCSEYIGSGEVILATRAGAILGSGILWAVILGIFLKYVIGLAGARYTVCTGEGMVDMFDRMPGPRHWVVWVVFCAQFVAAMIAIAALANAAGVFIAGIFGSESWAVQVACGWAVSLFAVAVVWSGVFEVLKIVMSFFVVIIVVGTIYVAACVFPPLGDFVRSLVPNVPVVSGWAIEQGTKPNAWAEILPLIGWGAGGFASQVWYTYWVLGAGYGAAAGRSQGQAARVDKLRLMSSETAEKIRGWCRVLLVDASLAMVIAVVVTWAFLIAGTGVLRPRELAPEGATVAVTLSEVFAANWGKVGAALFMLAGAAALIGSQVGQLAGWPRLFADSVRICFPSLGRRYSWKVLYRFFLVVFFFTSMVIIYTIGYKPVVLVKLGSILDGLLLTPLQALCCLVGLYFVLPRLLSAEAAKILKPSRILATGLIISFTVFTYFCVVKIPTMLFGK